MEFDFYRAGQINGQGAVLYMIRFWRPDGQFGSCQCVEEGNLRAEINALRKIGYQPRAVQS